MTESRCNHDNLAYKRTDTSVAPDNVYVEWWCEDCSALVSYPMQPTGRRIVQPIDGEGYDEEVEV